MPPAGVAGDPPAATRCPGNFSCPSNSSRVSPSLQVPGRVYFSVCTSTPAARKAATAHSTALAISGEPVTRPPTSSVNRRKFSSNGEGPITNGKIFAATCAHEDASAVEHPGAACDVLLLAKGSVFTGGNCAHECDAMKQRSIAERNRSRRILTKPSPQI